jgi:hypothetical protein
MPPPSPARHFPLANLRRMLGEDGARSWAVFIHESPTHTNYHGCARQVPRRGTCRVVSEANHARTVATRSSQHPVGSEEER